MQSFYLFKYIKDYVYLKSILRPTFAILRTPGPVKQMIIWYNCVIKVVICLNKLKQYNLKNASTRL